MTELQHANARHASFMRTCDCRIFCLLPHFRLFFSKVLISHIFPHILAFSTATAQKWHAQNAHITRVCVFNNITSSKTSLACPRGVHASISSGGRWGVRRYRAGGCVQSTPPCVCWATVHGHAATSAHPTASPSPSPVRSSSTPPRRRDSYAADAAVWTNAHRPHVTTWQSSGVQYFCLYGKTDNF